MLILFLFLLCEACLIGQEDASYQGAYFKEPISRLWVNTYGHIRLTNRLYWIAQTHFRFRESPNMPYAGQIGQIYNRHALNYKFNDRFNASFGGVLRLNFNTNEVLDGEERMLPEFRIWHEYLFSLPLERIKVCHRIRIEHRWSRGFKEFDDYIYRNRWRYMLNVKIPINKHKLEKHHTFYVSPEAELIMQSGKAVVSSPMEDLRLHASFGYIINPELTIATGLMYSMGQQLGHGDIYHQKYTIRAHVYFSPDWRKNKGKGQYWWPITSM